jgi:uncharacterized cupredoxin-like copper-binding protein
MRQMRRHVLSLATGLALAFGATAASAATIVNVDLWDKGADTPMAGGFAYGTPGLDLSKATMGMKLSRKSASAGPVTFHVTNSSKDQIHEMIVMYLANPSKPLPYIASESRVDEDKAGDKGEVSELDPGHYEAGMWAEFTVTK